MAKKKVKTVAEEIALPIKWHVSDSIIARFASNMTIQTLEYEFKVSFFEVKPEIRTNSNAPLPTEVRADCVASVIINAAKMPGFIKALQKQLELYEAKQQADITRTQAE